MVWQARCSHNAVNVKAQVFHRPVQVLTLGWNCNGKRLATGRWVCCKVLVVSTACERSCAEIKLDYVMCMAWALHQMKLQCHILARFSLRKRTTCAVKLVDCSLQALLMGPSRSGASTQNTWVFVTPQHALSHVLLHLPDIQIVLITRWFSLEPGCCCRAGQRGQRGSCWGTPELCLTSDGTQ